MREPMKHERMFEMREWAMRWLEAVAQRPFTPPAGAGDHGDE
jgi:hypothetical protein